MSRIIGVERMQQKIRTLLISFIRSQPMLTAIGKFSRDRIYSFTKSGKSIFGDEPEALKRLSPGYIKYRRKIQKTSNVGEHFRPAVSQLTFTGQMLNALTFKINQQRGHVDVFVKDTARDPAPTLGKKKRQEGPSLNNAQVAKKVSKERPFIGIDKKGQEVIKKMVIKDLRAKLRSSRLKK